MFETDVCCSVDVPLKVKVKFTYVSAVVDTAVEEVSLSSNSPSSLLSLLSSFSTSSICLARNLSIKQRLTSALNKPFVSYENANKALSISIER